jgi:hypothetical protein
MESPWVHQCHLWQPVSSRWMSRRGLEAPLLVLLGWRHIYDNSHTIQKNWLISWNTLTAYSTTFSSPWTLRWPSPFAGHNNYRRPDSSFGHKSTQEANHTNLYMNARFPHHPANNLHFHLTIQGQNHLWLGQPPSWTRHTKNLPWGQLQHETDPSGSQPPAENQTVWKGTHGSDIPALCLKYLQPHNVSIKGVLCPKWKLLL